MTLISESEAFAVQPSVQRVQSHLRSALSVDKDSAADSKDASPALDSFSEHELVACGALLHYVTQTQRGLSPRLLKPQRVTELTTVQIDAATRRSLEITTSLSSTGAGTVGGSSSRGWGMRSPEFKQYSLLSALRCTCTAGGSRLFASRLSAPLIDVAQIEQRLDAVHFFYDQPALGDSLRTLLLSCADSERAVQRLALKRGGPRDLVAIRQTIQQAKRIHHSILTHPQTKLPPSHALQPVVESLSSAQLDKLQDLLHRAVTAEPPLAIEVGGGACANFLFDALIWPSVVGRMVVTSNPNSTLS